MKKINITIPDDLTPQQEVLEIATSLRQNMLAGIGRNKDTARIGNEVNIQHLQTQITITRKDDMVLMFPGRCARKKGQLKRVFD